MNLYPKLLEYIKHCLAEFDLIPQKRKEELAVIGKYIRDCARKNEPAKLTFICTHNSRRSHLTQIWAQIAADYNGSGHVTTYSGGTEATAFNPRAVAALKRAGLTIEATGNPNNPHYQVNYSEKAEPLICYSKIYNAPENPQEDYLAIMTCTDADEACPIVFGAAERLSLPYIDPKISDDTPEESQTYDERCLQIAREMLFAMTV